MDRENKAYKKTLEHRKNCEKWGKDFCIECFGWGLNKFHDDYEAEQRKELGLPTIEKMIKQILRMEEIIDGIKKRKASKTLS